MSETKVTEKKKKRSLVTARAPKKYQLVILIITSTILALGCPILVVLNVWM